MVLPKRTIQMPSELKHSWDVDNDPDGITIFNAHQPVCHANWQDSDEFGMDRPAITLILPDEEDLDLFDAMVSRLAIAYENLPERYPLYIRLHKTSLDLIAHASRLGFIPYFGEWKESNENHSAAVWEEITNALRNREGLSA